MNIEWKHMVLGSVVSLGWLCCSQAHWVVAVREPSADDIDAAFKVFDEGHLLGAVVQMPQVRGWGDGCTSDP
jgi:hypothetical protein